MRRLLGLLVAGALFAPAATAQPTAPAAQPTAPSAPPLSSPTAPLPPNHPAISPPSARPPTPGAARPTLPSAPPLSSPTAPLPPNHPTISPHGGMAPEGGPSPNSEEPSADLPRGTVEAILVDAEDRPLPGRDVRLGILFQKIAEGESRTSKGGRTGPDGTVRFDGLEVGSTYAYRVSARSGPAEYASSPFNLRDSGMRVTLHVFAVTSNPNEAIVGMRGFFYIETRDDVFQIETLFHVMNLGKLAWVPNDVIMKLPEGFKAFNGGESMNDTRFEAVEGQGARLTGTFPPGQHDVSFRFQVPKEASTSAAFNVRPPTRTAEMRVIAVANKNMRLEVDGFEPAQEALGPNGDHVLVTRKLVARGESEVGAFSAVLTGLPAPDEGRWVAVLIALGFGITGGLAALGRLKLVSTERLTSDRTRARELLFGELIVLERAKRRGQVGPTAYERAHRLLVDALTRIGLPRDKRRAKRGAEGRSSALSAGS